MKTTQKDVDTMVVQQVAEVKANKVLFVAYNTSIFVLQVHFCCQGGIPTRTSVLKVLALHDRVVIYSNATVDKHIVTSSDIC